MKKNLIVLALAIIVLVIIIVLTTSKKSAIIEDSGKESGAKNSQTVDINAELESINVDAGIDEDMKTIDADLKNL